MTSTSVMLPNRETRGIDSTRCAFQQHHFPRNFHVSRFKSQLDPSLQQRHSQKNVHSNVAQTLIVLLVPSVQNPLTINLRQTLTV